jgi:uncharacterized protein YggE
MRSTSTLTQVLAVLLLAASSASAQAGPPTIVVSATASVEVVPDRANLRVAVETRGRTAAEAATANARIQSPVLAAIRRAGVADAQLRTSSVSVSPVYEYPREGGRPTLVGYQARNGVDVEIRDLAKIAAVLDAALAAGATSVDGPHFTIADAATPRRAALELAVKRARADAEAMASAAGVLITSVLEISTGQFNAPPMEFATQRLSSVAVDTATPVESGRITVSATVTVRFAIRAP